MLYFENLKLFAFLRKSGSKFFLCGCLLFVFFTISYCLLEIFNVSYTSDYTAKPRKTAHIYIDFASSPSFFQMVDAVKQKPTDPKLIILRRFKALENGDEILTSMNARMIDATALEEGHYWAFTHLVEENLKIFYKEYSDYHFIIHLNALHALESGHFDRIIPRYKIEAFHLYDDSIGRSLWDKSQWNQYKIIASKFPTYFHTKYYDPQILKIDLSKLVVTDFVRDASELSAIQRKKVAKIMGINFDDMGLLVNTKGRKTAVFIDDPHLPIEIATDFIKKMIRQKPEIVDYEWFYKNHPRVTYSGETLDVLKKYFKNVTIIPNTIPLESLVLVDFFPDYIAGYGSSIFYSFKKEQILGYIRRLYIDSYEEFLLGLGILDPDMVFDNYSEYGYTIFF